MATDEPGRRRLWELRERHTEAIAAAGIVHKLDVSVPPARLAEFIAGIGPALASAIVNHFSGSGPEASPVPAINMTTGEVLEG